MIDVVPHLTVLRRFAKKLTKSRSAAEELLNDTVVAALSSNTYDASRPALNWLGTVMYHQFLKNYSKKLERLRVEDDSIAVDELLFWNNDLFINGHHQKYVIPVDNKQTAEQQLVEREEISENKQRLNAKLNRAQETTWAAISRLSPRRREAVACHLQGKYGMMAYQTHLYNARRDLRAMGADLAVLFARPIP